MTLPAEASNVTMLEKNDGRTILERLDDLDAELVILMPLFSFLLARRRPGSDGMSRGGDANDASSVCAKKPYAYSVFDSDRATFLTRFNHKR